MAVELKLAKYLAVAKQADNKPSPWDAQLSSTVSSDSFLQAH